MLVKDYMTEDPPVVGPTMSIVEAQRFMGENRVRHLPVVGDGKRLVGLVTRQSFLVDPRRLGSLDVWEITRCLSGLVIKDVMIRPKDVVVVQPNATIEEAARVMVENKIGCLPVLEERIVVGLITDVDLLAQLMEMMATREPGVRVTVRMPNVKGELARLVGTIAVQGWGITACGGTTALKDPSKWDAVLKFRNVAKEEIIAVLESVEGQEIVDVREV